MSVGFPCKYIRYSSRTSLQLNAHTRTCLGKFVIKLACLLRAVRVNLAHANAFFYARVGRMHLMLANAARVH